MATEILNIEVTLGYPQVYEPDTYLGNVQWKLNAYPVDDNEWNKFKNSGIQKKIKNNSDETKGPLGDYFQVTRPYMRLIKGKMVYFTPPVVYKDDGTVIVDYINSETEKRVYSYSLEEKDKIVRRGKPVLLGNGTRAIISIAVYDTQKGKGQRLESVKILDLVEYEKKDQGLPPVAEDVRTPVSHKTGEAQSSGEKKDFPF